MQDIDYYSPRTLDDLVSVLSETSGHVLAGGTDIIPRMRRGTISSPILVDASHIPGLRFIKDEDGSISIGALTPHQEIVDSTLLGEAIPSLVKAAASIGCRQTRSRGTLGGNIVNASPAADTIPPLLTFDAMVHLVCKEKERAMALVDFMIGPGQTKLEPGEFIHSVSFNRFSGAWGSDFQKLGLRHGMAISVASAAALVELNEGGRICKARLALGSVAPTVVLSHAAEEVLLGQEPTAEILQYAAKACRDDIAPISDVRSTAGYRKHAAVVLARRVLEAATANAYGRRSS